MSRRKSVGCFAMLIFLVVGGVFLSVGYFVMLKPELEVGNRFVEGTCTILGKELVSEQSSSRRSKRRAGSSTRKKTVYRPEFHVRHEVAGQTYEARAYRIVKTSSSSKSSQEEVLARFEVGGNYPCWYDPDDPARVVVEKGGSAGSILFTGLGGLLVLVGVGGTFMTVFRRVVGKAG